MCPVLYDLLLEASEENQSNLGLDSASNHERLQGSRRSGRALDLLVKMREGEDLDGGGSPMGAGPGHRGQR